MCFQLRLAPLQLGSTRRCLLIAAESGGPAAAAAAKSAALLATEAVGATAETGWDRLHADPALFMGQLNGGGAGGGGRKGPDEAAEFAVGVFDIGDGLAAAAAAVVAACRRAAEEGLDVVALRSVVRPGRYCWTGHPTHFEPSFIVLRGFL